MNHSQLILAIGEKRHEQVKALKRFNRLLAEGIQSDTLRRAITVKKLEIENFLNGVNDDPPA